MYVWRGLFWCDFFLYAERTKDFLITLTPLEVCIRPSILSPYMYMTLLQLMWTQRKENVSLCQQETSVLDFFVK